MILFNSVHNSLVLDKFFLGNGHFRQGSPGIDVKQHGDRVFSGQKGGIAALLLQIELFDQFGNLTCGIIQIAEEASPSLADVDARRFDPVVDAVLAKRAFGNGVFGLVLAGKQRFVPSAGAIWTGIDALAAADTKLVVEQNQAVRTFIGGTAAIADRFSLGRGELASVLGILRTNFDAGGNLILLIALAMVAKTGHEMLLTVGEGAGDFLVNSGSKRA